MFRIIRYYLFFLACFYVPNSLAQTQISVSAVVGEEVITTYDLEQRLKIFALSSNLAINEQNKIALLQQIRELLITEKLKLQAAKELAIEVTEAEIGQALADIAKGNNVAASDLENFILAQGLSFSDVYARIEAELTWQKLVVKELSPRVNITDAEILEAKKIFVSKQKQTEVKYDFLTYKFNDTESKKLAEGLSSKIHQGLISGELDFANIKKSQAALIGDVAEWENIQKLKPDVRAALTQMQIGEISEPFISDTAILILKLVDKREVKFDANIDFDNKIKNNLYMSKLDNLVSSYLRDLESSYYVERKNIL